MSHDTCVALGRDGVAVLSICIGQSMLSRGPFNLKLASHLAVMAWGIQTATHSVTHSSFNRRLSPTVRFPSGCRAVGRVDPRSVWEEVLGINTTLIA